MYNTKADDLARIANDLNQLARKYNDGSQHLDQQIGGLDGTTQQLIMGGPEHWLGVSSIAFQGAWDERRARLQQVSMLLSQSAQHFTHFAQTIEENLPTIRADQAVQQSRSYSVLGHYDQQSIFDEESQAQNAIITALSLLNSQLEQLAEEVKDSPQEREERNVPGSDTINRSDAGDTGAGGKGPEQSIKESVGDQKLAQSIIELAQQNGANLDDVATLLKQGIDTDTLTQLITNKANLKDISTNAQTLLDGGVRVDLVNTWLKNKTKLNDAVAILNQGVDLNLIGTSNQVGNFTNLTGASVNDVVSKIPADARILPWTPDPAGAQEGMKFQWKDASGKIWNVRMHGPDLGATAGSNAANGWVLRVQRGSYYMDATGNFYKDTMGNPRSPNYNPDAANATHMPIQHP